MRDVAGVVKTFTLDPSMMVGGSCDMIVLKVTQTEQGLAILLTDEAAVALRVKAGDALHLDERSDGEFRLYGRGPTLSEEISLGEAFMREYRGAFRTLAK